MLRVPPVVRAAAGAALAALLVATVACVPSAPQAATKGLLPLKIGLGGGAPPDVSAHQFYYPKEKGFFAANGVDVELMPFNGDQTALRALAAREVDVAFVGCGTAMAANEVGSPVRFISAFAPNADYQFLAMTDITSLKGMEGRSLGVSQIGAVSHLVPQLMIQAAGGDVSKVNVVSIGGSGARVQALAAKKVDSAVLNATFVPRAKSYEFLHVVADAPTALPDYLFSCEVTRTDTIAEKGPALQGFVNGMMEGTRWFYTNPAEAKQISKKITPDAKQEEIDYAVDTYTKTKYLSTTGEISEKAFDFTTKAQVDARILTQTIKLSQMYEPRFLQEAKKKLGG